MAELTPRKSSGAPYVKSAYNGRWRWWYASISDALIADPTITYAAIAAKLGKGPNTISMIANSDMFRTYHAKRMEEFRAAHDTRIRTRLTDVAEMGLDLILISMERKKDQVPMEILAEVTTGALDRLGYGTKASPQVVINNNADQRSVTIQGVSAAGLEEARLALRKAEELRAIESRESEYEILPPSAPASLASGEKAEPLNAVNFEESTVAEEADAPLRLGD